MSLAKPPGCRATDLGGEWKTVRLGKGGTPGLMDVDKVLRLVAGDVERGTLVAEIRRQILRATKGQLRMGSGPGAVKQMMCVTDVLEIIVGPSTTTSGDAIHVRIYYSEPDAHPDLLLGLSIRGKSPGAVGKQEQDEHAFEAQDRYDDWEKNPRYA